MRITILTLFPELFGPYFNTGVIGRAVKNGQIEVTLKNIRDYTTDAHRTVDDTPYGGGAGMVMKIEPIHRALQDITSPTLPSAGSPLSLPRRGDGGEVRRIVVLSAKGAQFTQQKAQQLSQNTDHLILLCGRYEGVDQRVIDHLSDEEISIGPYVLAGGELPALTVVEAVARLLPGVLGNPESLTEESHSEGNIEYPQYTKPAEYQGWSVPDVLLTGNHAEIKKWREAQRRSTL